MRTLVAPRTKRDASLPDTSVLHGVRDLGSRFPGARLREVPVVRARELDLRADASGATRVWLAIESLQVTGSFKVRGALVAIAALRERTPGSMPHVVAASAGNHGAGLAYAAKALGVRATVVVPSSAPRAKRDRIAASGAEVVLASTPHYDDAEAEAITLAAREGAYFLSPYDDIDVLAGNGGSLGYEISRALGRVPETVIAPLGGGGLATGLACALADEAGDGESAPSADRSTPEAVGGERRRVWGAQSEACPAMARSLEAGSAVVRLEADETFADGLEGGISVRGFARAAATVAGVVVVSEAAIAGAMAHAVRELGLVIEGSAACALAPVLDGLPGPLRGGDLVAVLTGRNVDPKTLDLALART
jgi:threonine dehydratase